MAGINEEEVKIRERLTSLETKLGFIHGLLQEIRDELKDQPSKEDYEELKDRVAALEKTQVTVAIKVGITTGFIGMVAGFVMRMISG